MKMSVVNRKFSILILPFLLASFVLVGCGEDDEDNNRLVEDNNRPVEDNNQPVIEAIPDKIVDADGAVTVEVNITDVDGDDTHTIRASSNNKAIATVSAKNTTLTINGIAGGMATITVSVTDNSGQENAAATPITFEVTVDANSQPVIQAIPDVTLDAGAESTVAVNITDADIDNTHTISASSDDTAIAAVSVQNTTLIISGIAEGTTTITVSATDDSGKNNAAATPLTFQVTVLLNNTVPGDPAFSTLVEASANGDDLGPLFDRATKLRAGLEFPRNTFAVNEKHTILVAHTDGGRGLVIAGARFEAGGDINLGWLTFVNRGDVRVLTHYDP